MRNRTGKAARLSGKDFDSAAVNTVAEKEPEVESEKVEATTSTETE